MSQYRTTHPPYLHNNFARGAGPRLLLTLNHNYCVCTVVIIRRKKRRKNYYKTLLQDYFLIFASLCHSAPPVYNRVTFQYSPLFVTVSHLYTIGLLSDILLFLSQCPSCIQLGYFSIFSSVFQSAPPVYNRVTSLYSYLFVTMPHLHTIGLLFNSILCFTQCPTCIHIIG